jgi:hypothetical protein
VTISVVQSVAINNGYSGNFGTAVTAGSSIAEAVTGHNGTASDISTSSPLYNGGSVTGASKLVEQNSPSEAGAAYSSIWLLPDVAGGGTSLSITITNSPAASYVGIIAYEVAGLGSSPTVDKSNSNTGSGTEDQNSGASGNITQGPEFVLGTVTQDGTIGSSYPPSGWTSMNVGTTNSVAGYQIPASSGGSYTYDLGAGSAHWTGAIATIYAASGGTPHTATAALTVTPSFSAPRVRGKYRTASLTVTPSFTAARTPGKYRTAALTVTPSFAATRLHIHGRTAGLVVDPSFSAARVVSHARHAALTITPSFTITWTGGAPKAAPQTGSWWGLDTVLKQSREEFQEFISRPPMACPVCGEPLTNAPATRSGSGVELYCRYAGDHEFHYPRDWQPPSRPWY